MGGAVHGRRWRAPKTPTLLDVLWVRGRLKLSKGYLSRVPHFNSICNYLENPELTPILYSLITETSLPLKSVEVDFAADSSGFTTSRSCDGSIINIRSCFPILLIRRPKISPSARFPLIRATEA